MKKTELDKLRKNYYKNGWILYKKIFTKKEIKDINDKIDSFLKKKLPKIFWENN